MGHHFWSKTLATHVTCYHLTKPATISPFLVKNNWYRLTLLPSHQTGYHLTIYGKSNMVQILPATISPNRLPSHHFSPKRRNIHVTCCHLTKPATISPFFSKKAE